MSQETVRELPAWPAGICRRVLAMTAVWLVLGMLLGATISLRQRAAPVAFASHLIAGMIVCLVPGVCLGLVSRQAMGSLLGGLGGLAVGLLSPHFLGAAVPVEMAELCLIIGALVGATLWIYLSGVAWLAKLAIATIQKTRRITGSP